MDLLWYGGRGQMGLSVLLKFTAARCDINVLYPLYNHDGRE